MQFVEPWFLGRKLEFSWDLYYRELGFQSLEGLYDESRGGTRLGWRRPLWSDFFIGSVAYTIENVGIINVDEFNAPQTILDEKGFSLLSEVSASLTYDARRYDVNRGVQLPVGGHKTELIGSVMGGPLGGDQDLYKLEARTSWYFRPPTNLFGGKLGGHLLEIIGRTGVAQEYSVTDQVPFYERYYLGGLYTLRGYQYRAVGPREAGASGQFEPIGGNTYWFATAEYSIPIIEQFRLAAFYDIGMVYPDSFSYSPEPGRGRGYDTGGYSDNWGVGVRLNLPIGPLRLDYAFPITHDEFSGSGGRFQFGIGYTRSF
jgi:outer membrane protein insertion porin family